MTKQTITEQEAADLAMAIAQNENVMSLAEISDSQICYYLCDKGIEESKENIAAIRKA